MAGLFHDGKDETSDVCRLFAAIWCCQARAMEPLNGGSSKSNLQFSDLPIIFWEEKS